MEALQEQQGAYYKTEAHKVYARDVVVGDVLFDLEVNVSRADDQNYIWLIKAADFTEEAGLVLRITEDHPVTVWRQRQVGENECRDCGRLNVKYSARHLCNTCYQREYRSAQRTG